MERVFKPRGVTIYGRRGRSRITGKVEIVHFSCTVKSKGRTGARARQRLMGLRDMARQSVLRDWAAGRPTTL